MTALGIDLGATKLSLAVFTQEGEMLVKKTLPVHQLSGTPVADLMISGIHSICEQQEVQAIGVAVPGIYHQQDGTVWAPNISGWENYPLQQQLRENFSYPIAIDSDRAAYIMGESWVGNARGFAHAIYLAVGTGIGAGILVNGKVLRGAHDIAGAIGWMALQSPFKDQYINCGCFESMASGSGIVKLAREYLGQQSSYNGLLAGQDAELISSSGIFEAFEKHDPIAVQTLQHCIRLWGMAVANLVSLFDPEIIIMGGGVFGPALKFLPDIRAEAERWAQPVSMPQLILSPSSLGSDAGLYGAGHLAFQSLNTTLHVS
jgi:glucokinase